jgi:NAD(P)-dependent dehydrogenase (short-subunit alcohol dehydrogenase family)
MTRDVAPEGLSGKRVIVTGGAGDIGLATAARFAAHGASVALFDLSAEALGRAVGSLPGALAVQVDVADPGAVGEAYRTVERELGGVDVLIANAGISFRTPVLDISDEEWRQVVDVNLSGVFYCAREAGRRMVEQGGGAILMTASTNGLKGYPNYAHYNASKAGVIVLAKTMALELAPTVRVNAICPGYVLTAMQEAEYTQEMMREVNGKIPMGRHASPDEIARLFAFLASDSASYMTGQAIVIDGGEIA